MTIDTKDQKERRTMTPESKNEVSDLEAIYNLADTLYWEFIDKLSDEGKSQFVIKNPDDDGTINTDKGSDLYYAIEDILKERIGVIRNSLEIMSFSERRKDN